MPDPNFITYLKTLKPADWQRMATSKWTVKDVVAHMVGWERGDVEAVTKSWETKTEPWWITNPGDDAYNEKWVEFYKNYTPEQLIAEWEMWQEKVRQVIEQIGKDNLKAKPEVYGWLFEGIEDQRMDGRDSHYKHHYKQIREAIESP